jgi:hypothetical protein
VFTVSAVAFLFVSSSLSQSYELLIDGATLLIVAVPVLVPSVAANAG